MSTHQEFPIMTPEAQAAHDAAVNAIRNTNATISPNDFRRDGCDDCLRRTAPGGGQWMKPPSIIVFECEWRIGPGELQPRNLTP